MDRQIKKFPVSQITVREDYIRKDIGDVSNLVTAYLNGHIIHPPTIRSNGELVCGYRRFSAAKIAGMVEIDVIINDKIDTYMAETRENADRKDLSFTETMVIVARTENTIQNIGELRGKTKQDIENKLLTERGELPPLVKEFLNFNGKTREFIASYHNLGSGKTYDHMKAIKESAIPEVIVALDKDAISINRAYEISQSNQKKQLTLLNNSIQDIDTDKDILSDVNNKRRKAKRKDKARIPDSPTADPIYNIIRVSPDWVNEKEEDLLELPVYDYSVSVGVVCVECPNNKLASAINLISGWGYYYAATITIYNAKAPAESHRPYIKTNAWHIVIGQRDPEIPMPSELVNVVYNRQNIDESGFEIYSHLWPSKSETRLDMSTIANEDTVDGWVIWKTAYAKNQDQKPVNHYLNAVDESVDEDSISDETSIEPDDTDVSDTTSGDMFELPNRKRN